MNVLMISSGTNLNFFKDGSPERRRMLAYAKLVDELHIIVFSPPGYPGEKLGDNIWIYPTSSTSKTAYVGDAVRIGKAIRVADLITAQDPFEAGLAGLRIARVKKIPLQIQVHTDLASPYFAKKSTLNRMRKFLAGFVLPRATCIRAVSERVKNGLVAEYGIQPQHISVLPIRVPLDQYKNGTPAFSLHEKYKQFEFIILAMGRLAPEKRLELSVDALAAVVKKYPRVGMVIVGEGPEKERLEEQIEEKDLTRNVVFEPWTTDTISYLKTADLYLNTSQFEGYGMTLVEAAAAGCPIVSTNVGIVGSVLSEKNAFIAEPEDLKGLTEKLFAAIEHRDMRKEYAQEAQEAVLRRLNISEEQHLVEMRRSWQMCV